MIPLLFPSPAGTSLPGHLMRPTQQLRQSITEPAIGAGPEPSTKPKVDAPVVAPENTAIRPRLFARVAIGPQAVATLKNPIGDALAALDSFRSLAPNWDSYGAAPITGAAVRSSRRLLRHFQETIGRLLGRQIRPFNVVPIATGGIQLEWRGPGGALEVEVLPSGAAGYLLVRNTEHGPQYQEEDQATDRALRELLATVLTGEEAGAVAVGS